MVRLPNHVMVGQSFRYLTRIIIHRFLKNLLQSKKTCVKKHVLIYNNRRKLFEKGGKRMDEVSLGAAFLAGMVTFFSPCVFPLVPAYLAQLTGSNVQGGAINANRGIILSRSLGFISGFTIIFVLLGVSATAIGTWFAMYGTLIERIGGIVIILFGLQMSGLISLRSLLTERKVIKRKPKKVSSFSGSVGYGLVFAAGWTPCIGLILGSILYMASREETMFSGVGLLLIYSIGLGIPFLLVALLFSQSLNKLSVINRYLPLIQKTSGVIMILLGIALFTGLFSTISAYFGNFVPSWL